MIYHSAIFYPDSSEELRRLCGDDPKLNPAKALILPQMELTRCAWLYRKGFQHIPDGKDITLVLPLHREVLASDSGSILFQAEPRTESFITGSITIADAGLPSRSCYEKEEFAQELLFPFIPVLNPSSRIRIIFTCASSSAETKTLRAHLELFRDTIYVVSGNMTGFIDEKKADEETEKMIKHLENGDKLLDFYRKGLITSPASPIIEAISQIVPGRWELIGKAEGRKAGHAAMLRC